MTKKFKTVRIGETCSKGIFCGLLTKPVIFKQDLKICHGVHIYEIYKPNKPYTRDFDTVRPEMFIGDDK